MSSHSEQRGRRWCQISIVNKVLALLKIEVSEDMRAAIMTDIIRPRSPAVEECKSEKVKPGSWVVARLIARSHVELTQWALPTHHLHLWLIPWESVNLTSLSPHPPVHSTVLAAPRRLFDGYTWSWACVPMLWHHWMWRNCSDLDVAINPNSWQMVCWSWKWFQEERDRQIRGISEQRGRERIRKTVCSALGRIWLSSRGCWKNP